MVDRVDRNNINLKFKLIKLDCFTKYVCVQCIVMHIRVYKRNNIK